MDAPSHFKQGAASVDEIPLSQLTGNGEIFSFFIVFHSYPDELTIGFQALSLT